ncbi:MAG: hypothetical protein GY696_09935 [Gammaproteobacteria bacterium]|nr:hypothetical protein [Gammaproteobacteria bacterium]
MQAFLSDKAVIDFSIIDYVIDYRLSIDYVINYRLSIMTLASHHGTQPDCLALDSLVVRLSG